MVGTVIGTEGWLSKPLALRMYIKRNESDGVCINRRKPPPTLAMGTFARWRWRHRSKRTALF